MFSAQVNIEFLLQPDEILLALSLDQGLASVCCYSQRSGARDCPCRDKTESTSVLSRSFMDLRTQMKTGHTILPLFSPASFLSLSAANLDYSKQTLPCPHIVLCGHQLAMPLQLKHTKTKWQCSPHPPPRFTRAKTSSTSSARRRRMAIWKLILNKVLNREHFLRSTSLGSII